MQADKVLREILAREQLTQLRASRILGKSDKYMSTYLSRGNVPRIDSMATICDRLGYDLIVRCRDDGYEFEIDPKLKD